jgi:hypothetical protein
MHHTGYLVWINDQQYWHRTMQGAHARVRLAQLSGKDAFIRSLKPASRPIVALPAPRRAA